MANNIAKIAPKLFLEEGYSCSESIVMAACILGLVDEKLVSVATSFSGGMGSGCLCGAVAGAQMVIGALHGKNKDNSARMLAREFYKRITDIHKVTCCKVLTREFKDDFHSIERKKHCANMVFDCANILDNILIESETKINS